MYQRDLVTGFVSPTVRMDTGNARATLRTTLTTENDIVGMRIVKYDSHNPNRDENNNRVQQFGVRNSTTSETRPNILAKPHEDVDEG